MYENLGCTNIIVVISITFIIYFVWFLCIYFFLYVRS